MYIHYIRTPEEACSYLLNCVLATVDDQSMTKSRRKSYYLLNLEAAQLLYSSTRNLGIPLGRCRSSKVERLYRDSVLLYSEAIEKTHNVNPFKNIEIRTLPLLTSIIDILEYHYSFAISASEKTTSKREKSRQLDISKFAQKWINEWKKINGQVIL